MTQTQVRLIMKHWDFENAGKLARLFFDRYPEPYTKEQIFDFLGL